MKKRKALSHGLIIFGVILLGLVLFCIYGRYGDRLSYCGLMAFRSSVYIISNQLCYVKRFQEKSLHNFLVNYQGVYVALLSNH